MKPKYSETILQQIKNNLNLSAKNDVFIFPASFAQTRMWLLQQLDPESYVYHNYQAIRLTGELNIIALENSINEIFNRHEVLRTTFATVEGQPVQVISSNNIFNLPIIDLSNLSKADKKNRTEKILIEEGQRPFDLTKSPLMRCSLLKLAENEHLLSLNIHHIIGDGWSGGILIREIATLYKAFREGKPSSLTELPIQYADFTIYQRDLLQGEVLENLLKYWKQQLNNLPILNLPTDYPRKAIETFNGATKSFALTETLTNKIKELSKQEGVTLFITLLTAFKVLLYRYSQQKDIVVGSPIANRNLTQTENLIGCFVNTLVLRSDLNGNPTFRELLGRVREVTLAAYAHQDLPFEKLVEALQPERDLSRQPLFQVAFVFQNAPMSELKLPDLALKPLSTNIGTSKFELTLYMEEVVPQQIGNLEYIAGSQEKTSTGLIGLFEYNTDLFDADTINCAIAHFQTLLEGIVANPEQTIAQLPLLTTTEQKLFRQWNNTTTDYPQDKCIHQLFEQQVEKNGNAVAVVFEKEQLTYQQLNQKANQLAHYLLSLEVKPETKVGICLERSQEMLIGLLAILKAGAGYIPLDPAYPQQRKEFILSDAQISILLTDTSNININNITDKKLVCLNKDRENIAAQSTQNPITKVNSNHLAYIIYTSGSTGKPKGVEIAHHAVINFLTSMQQKPGLTTKDTLLAVTTISFDIAALELYLPLITGAKLILTPKEITGDGQLLSELIDSEDITVMQATPATWRMLLAAGWNGCANLKILCGGEALSNDLARQLLTNCSSLWNLYGPTETTIWSTVSTVDTAQLSHSTIPIGRPINNTQIYLYDEYQQPVPIGVVGEIYIGGSGLARGYLNRPQLTQSKFIHHQSGKLLYKTGDLGRYLEDGSIEYIGRIDNQVKIRGFRIELGEIEAVLSQHPQVKQAVVICSEELLVAYIVSNESVLADIRDFVAQKLPSYMVPNIFVNIEALPLTPNGKVDRKALPAPDGEITGEHEYIAPRTQNEEIISNIFTSVLRVENVGIHDNFFQLGGHSLLATQLISRLKQAFSLEIPLRTLFESPTVAQLEQTLTQSITTQSSLNICAIQPRTSEEQLPLSWAQERLWFLNQLEESSATYNIPGAVRISGNLDINALQKSLSEIVRRHEVLRTSFQSLNGTPIQVIHSEATMKINLVDLQKHSEQERETVLQQQAEQEAITPFDLEIAPLIRCCFLQLDTTEYVLLLTMHHIVSDGWSIGVFIQELSSLYRAFSAGKPSSLTELPIQYADFAVWQREYLSGEVLETQLNYWKQQLYGVPELLQLPTDYPRPTVQTYRGSTQSFILDNDLTQKLQSLSGKSGTTLFMTLYAGFATLLYRYSGQSDIVIGSPIANRNRSEIESLIGFFVNTLVLRSRFVDNPSFEKLLAQVRETTLGAYEHQDVPFEQVVEALQPQRSLAYSPLFQVMFVLQNAPMGEVKLPGATLSPLNRQSTISKFDLTLSITETDGELVGEWEYNSDLFDESTIERMAAHFQNLLSAIVENPKQDVSSFNLLTRTEEKLLKDWNNNQVDYPQDKCIHQLFEQQVEKNGNAVAVVFEQEQLTYQQLNQRANKLAHYLQSQGVGAETKVGICLERSSEMLIGLLAILKAGATYIPLDPAYPQQRLELILSDARISILLTDISNINLNNIKVKTLVCLTQDRENIAAQSTQNPITKVNSNNLAYIIYTSGSTGKPKGVEIAHHAVVNLLTSMQQKPGLTQEDALLAVTTISFDIAALELYLPLITGAKLILATKQITGDGKLLSELIETEQVTVMQATPATWRMLLAAGWKGSSNLKILCGGEALTNDLARQLLISGSSLWNLYGPTETTIWSSIYQVETTQLETNTIPIGKPINNTQIYLYDEYQQPVPIGVVGEIYIGGSGIARGYLNREQLTSDKFIHHQSGKLLYKTGDLGRYLEDGSIEYIGRIDNQVKIRGFRIELGEIEAVLSQHPQVNQAVVICSEELLVAYIVSNQEIADIRDFVAQKLPSYMVPNIFVNIDALPLTPNGKVDRKALPAPQQTIAKTNINPRNPIEQILVNIWSEILNIEKVSIEDNFFELGGHSLLATQVISRVRSDLNIEVPLRQLFATPTVADLAEFIQQSQQDAQPIVPPLLPVSRDRQLPISFAQERLWILDQLEGESPFYNIPAAISLVGQLNVSALQQSFQEIINRHEVLRTNFTNVDGQPVQIIHPHLEVKLPVIDLRSRCLDERTQETQRLATEQVQVAFDLTRDCLIRGCLLQLDDTEYLLLLTMHHIISDAWSLGVMTRELATLYNAFRNGQSSPLLPLEIQYADFALWQRQWFQGDVLQQQLDFWKQQLGTNLPVLQLPTSHPKEKIPINKLAEHTFLIPGDLAESIYSLNRQEGVTLFMTLLAAFNILLQRYSNQDDIVVGTDVANRNRKEIESLIGFFINILVLRNDLKGNPTFRELLGRVSQVTLDAYAHQDLPFAELVKALQPNRGVNSTPLFQVLFVLQNVPQSSLEFPGLTIDILETQQEVAKFDIALFLTETKQGITGKWQYKEDLFEGNLIAKMSDNFQTLLENIVNQPDARINDLEILSEVEKQKQTQQKQQRKNIKRKKFINAKPKTVNFSQSNLIKTSYLNDGANLPLVITPENNNIDIIDWAKNNREFLKNKLIESGGILFRNFSITSPEDFEKLAQAICPKLFENYGDLPRTGVSGKVYGSTPYPSEQAILFHNESSHMHCYPQKIWFYCMQPAQSRGETPIVDCRKLLQLLDPKLRKKFEQKQLMYVRNYTEGLDVSWQNFFGTTDKKEVENYCHQAAINFEWKSNGDLKTSQVRPAIIKHPKTSESVFFNQLLLHHVSCLQADVQEHMLSLFGEENLPRHVYYGDGSSIENSVVEEILATCREAEVSFPWQQGDVLMLDNILTSHGRNPYVGSRKIVVAMGDMISNQEIEK